MSLPVVATVAWLALVVAVGLAAVVAVLAHRLDRLARAHTDRKWEIALLRSELGALRRSVDGEPGPADVARSGRTWPASPTAWRRDRSRSPVRPRRRRTG